MVKYPLWVQKLLYYMIQHKSGCYIDFQQMAISPRQTTANNCKTASAYMSSRALATTTTSSLYVVLFCRSQLTNISWVL